MAKSKELCGSCCKGSQPIRKSFNECRLCACGAPFFSQIVVENNLPTSRRCLIEIPREFIEDHGYRFDKMDKTVILEEEDSDSEVHRVKIGGNNFVGFGFEWRDFARLHNIGIGQIIVFTLVRNSRFLVQIYKPCNSSSIATKPQTSVEVEQTCPVRIQVAPKIEDDDDDDDIEICAAQDWLVAKASKSNLTNPGLVSKVKVENVFSETSTGQATRAPEKYGGVEAKGKQKCEVVPKVEPDSEIINEVQPTPVFTTPARDDREERGHASPRCYSTENEESEGSDSSSTSDSVWSPRKSTPRDVRNNAKRGASTDSDTQDEDEVVLNVAKRRGKRLFSEGTCSSVDKAKEKKVGPSDMGAGAEADCPNPIDEEEMIGRKSPLLVEGYIVKKDGHEWHRAGTKRGRTYVSKRRPVTEAEKEKTLERARQVHINHPSFLKQLHKDSCHRSLKLFPPTPFYRDNMISATIGSYQATLEDESGGKWRIRIMGMKIFWKHFTLDHNLEEDDVVVFELMDPRPESIRFLVHIFRVLDIKKPLTGKAGWAVYYDVVEGTKKQYFEERRRLLEAQGLKKQKKQKRKQTDGLSSKPKSNAEITEFYRSKKNSDATEFNSRASASQGKGKSLQEEQPAPDSPNASRNQVEVRASWRRPTTRIRSREMNQYYGELLTKRINVKHELEQVLGGEKED